MNRLALVCLLVSCLTIRTVVDGTIETASIVPEWKWADQLPDWQELLINTSLQYSIMSLAAHWEGKFAQDGIGFDYKTGMTINGVYVDYYTGLMTHRQMVVVFPSEAIHLSMLAIAVNGSMLAKEFFTSSMPATSNANTVDDYVVEVLRRKISTMEAFNCQFPGFGGYAERMTNQGSLLPFEYRCEKIFAGTVGIIFWPMIAVVQALTNRGDAQHIALAERYEQYLHMLAGNFLPTFLNTTKQLYQFDMFVLNSTAPLSRSNLGPADFENYVYSNIDADLSIYLAHFYANWSEFGDETVKKAQLREQKELIESFCFNSAMGDIILQEFSIYSADERLQYLMLPYLDRPINNKVYSNGERARAYYSNKYMVPGLFGTTLAMPTAPNEYTDNIWPCGIRDFESDPFDGSDPFGECYLVAPYAAFPLILHPELRGYGIAWYLAMLHGSKMQGPLGATVAGQIDGPLIVQKHMWLPKLTPILAFEGGITRLTKDYLSKTGHLDEFYAIVDDQWESVFGSGTLDGELCEVMLPNTLMNNNYSTFNWTFDWIETTTTPPIIPEQTTGSKSSSNMSILILIGSCVLALVIVIICALILRISKTAERKRKRFLNLLRRKQYFQQERPSNTKHDKWEIGENDLKITQRLSEDQTGELYQAILMSPPPATQTNTNIMLEVLSCGFVTVKVMPSSLDLNIRKAFVDEINFMKQLRTHPNLINLLACITDLQQSITMVTEYCAGGDLLRYLRTKKKDECNLTKQLFGFAQQIIDAMIHLTQQQILHRDLSARNIYVTDRPSVKMGNFSVSRCLNDTVDSLPFHKNPPVKWMAPEAIRERQFSEKSEVWSFGVVLYEVFSLGEIPYKDIATALLMRLEMGYRLEKPDLADEKIYEIMSNCFEWNADDRPGFDQLRNSFVALLQENASVYGYVQAIPKKKGFGNTTLHL